MNIQQKLLEAFTPKSILNRDSESAKPLLPFGLVHSIETRLSWFCDTDQDGRLTSVYKYLMDDGKPDYQIEYLPSYSSALERRNYLLNPPDGSPKWIYFVPPRIEMTMDSPSGDQKPLNRKQKRKLGKMITIQENTAESQDELNRQKVMQLE